MARTQPVPRAPDTPHSTTQRHLFQDHLEAAIQKRLLPFGYTASARTPLGIELQQFHESITDCNNQQVVETVQF